MKKNIFFHENNSQEKVRKQMKRTDNEDKTEF